jgi:hypothetical protein
MCDDVPLNSSVLHSATRAVRLTLDRAERGDLGAQRCLVRMAAADDLSASLKRLAALAECVAPSLDDLKTNALEISADAAQLRYEVDTVSNILNQAAGRATVVALPVARATTGESPASGDAA